MPCPPPQVLPNPGIKLGSPALQVDSLPAELPGKPKTVLRGKFIAVNTYINIYIKKGEPQNS